MLCTCFSKIEVLLLPTDCSAMVLCSFNTHYLWIPFKVDRLDFDSAQVITDQRYRPSSERPDVMTECKQYVWGSMTGAQPSLLVVLAQLLALEGLGSQCSTASEPCYVHLHAVVESKDGGGAGGGRALLQVADALVQVLPRQQQGFGRQVL